MLAFLLRIAHINGESLWRDEVDTIRFAFVSLDQLIGNITRAGFNGPLYHLLMRGWLSLAGINDFALRYFSLLCGVAQVMVLYALANRLFGRRVAIVAAWLAAIAPALIWYSGEGKMYTLQPLLIGMALYALRRATEAQAARPAGWWAVFVIATSLGYYTHLLTPLFLVVAAIFVIAWWPQAKRHWKGLVIALALCTLPYVPLVIWQLPLWLRGADSGHTAYPLDVMGLSLLYTWTLGLSSQSPFGIGAQSVWLGILSYVTVAGLGIAATLSARQRTVIGVVAWLILPTLLVFLVSTRVAVFQPRYLLWSAPALYLLTALGLVWLWQRGPIVAGLVAIWLAVFSGWGIAAQVIYPIRPDLRGAAQALAAELGPEDRLVFQIPYTRYAFQYYLPQYARQYPVDAQPLLDDGLATIEGLRQRIIEAPYTNNGGTPESVDETLRHLLAPGRRIWLIEVEAPLWDEQGLVRAWFDEHLELVNRRDFRGVSLGHYATRQRYTVFLPIMVTAPPAPLQP